MNKIAIIALACAAPVMAGTPVVVAPAAPAPAPAVSPWSMEAGIGYNFAGRDLIKHSEGAAEAIDTLGVDLTAVRALTDHSALTLRFGYSFGDEVNCADRYWGAKHETDVHTFSLMPGYRYTHALTEKVSAFAGANVGVANMSVKDHWRDAVDCYSEHDSAWGVGYSAEVGLRYALCPRTEVFAAYQFSGNTARIKLGEEAPSKNHRQFYNGVRTGVSIKF